MESFFRRQRNFTNFLEFIDSRHYAAPPQDWVLVISDLRGSTHAIESGKYKLINMIGASSIVAVSNTLGTVDFPFVFGGDGAMALVPATHAEEVKRALRAIRHNAKATYGMHLCVGMVPLKAIAESNGKIEVAKFALGGGPSIALFRGNGITLAEGWVKSGSFLVEDGEEAPLDEALKGLSCRWAPLKSERGCILTLMIKAAEGKNSENVLKELLTKIHLVADLSSPEAHPIKPESMVAEGYLQASALESGIMGRRLAWLSRLSIMAQMSIVAMLRKFNLSAQGIKIREYLRDSTTHSDYRKFDEVLRLVFDCTLEKKNKVLALLEEARSNGKIFYGALESDSALLTCFVQRLTEGQHIHFVDGNHGGYALAAKQLKSQMAEAHQKRST